MNYPFVCACGQETTECRCSIHHGPPPAPACTCGKPMYRVYSSSPIVIRPTGWDRSPDDPAYWDDLTDPEERPTAHQ